MPLANPKFVKTFNTFVPVDAEGAITYRVPADFITPFAGLYSWVITGTVQKKGHPPVTFYTKWTSLQPRIPYGPVQVIGKKIINDPFGTGTFVQAPEGWYDGVRPPGLERKFAPESPKLSSPSAMSVMRRRLTGK